MAAVVAINFVLGNVQRVASLLLRQKFTAKFLNLDQLSFMQFLPLLFLSLELLELRQVPVPLPIRSFVVAV